MKPTRSSESPRDPEEVVGRGLELSGERIEVVQARGRALLSDNGVARRHFGELVGVQYRGPLAQEFNPSVDACVQAQPLLAGQRRQQVIYRRLVTHPKLLGDFRARRWDLPHPDVAPDDLERPSLLLGELLALHVPGPFATP